MAFAAITTLFFSWGFITSMNDPLIPAVKAIFHLSYAESLLTQFAFFIAYGIVSIPGGWLVARIGYGRAIVFALGTMMVGCLCFPIATSVESYALVLIALFIVASGMTVLQVAANPLSAALGKPEQAHFRLTLVQAFNSLGTVLGPYLGSALMLSGGVFAMNASSTDATVRGETLRSIDSAYFAMAAMLCVPTCLIWWKRTHYDRLGRDSAPNAAHSIRDALRSQWAVLGATAIFLYVGAEVSIGSLLVNFLQQPAVLGLTAEAAGKLTSVYWLGAMLGRFAGSALLRRASAPRLLACAAGVAALLCLVVSQSHGLTAAVAALGVGLVNSIMFPVIFTITLERSTARAESTSGLLCMAIVGGALLPPLAGYIADFGVLRTAFFVPLLAYAAIAAIAYKAYGVRLAHRPATHFQ